ncbi:hypothetical protein C8J56DRAFT_1053072 [Mycena floridula]|nr:hypothetical protein C8J56DRAFT_1053072 [Mycena floridula]
MAPSMFRRQFGVPRVADSLNQGPWSQAKLYAETPTSRDETPKSYMLLSRQRAIRCDVNQQRDGRVAAKPVRDASFLSQIPDSVARSHSGHVSSLLALEREPDWITKTSAYPDDDSNSILRTVMAERGRICNGKESMTVRYLLDHLGRRLLGPFVPSHLVLPVGSRLFIHPPRSSATCDALYPPRRTPAIHDATQNSKQGQADDCMDPPARTSFPNLSSFLPTPASPKRHHKTMTP